jgi:hypothetical protein
MTRYLEQFDQAPVEARWPLVRSWIVERSLPFYAELRENRPILTTPEVSGAFCRLFGNSAPQRHFQCRSL